MLQAEIAGRTIPSCGRYPEVGRVMRDFQFWSSVGRSTLLSGYRQHSNMVLVFTGESRFPAELLSELESHRPDLAGEETRVLVLVGGSQPQASELKRALQFEFRNIGGPGWPGASLHGNGRPIGAHPSCCIYQGPVWRGVCRIPEHAGQKVAAEEIIGWIDFINFQCPECGPLEWPD